MKPQTLPVKRRPVPKGIFRRLSAVTYNRRQRVAAAVAAHPTDLEADDGSSKISRALIIIFLIHIVAIALIFVHQRFLNGREGSPGAEAASVEAAAAGVTVTEPRNDLPRLSSGENPYIVKPGDNYARIAAAENVDEASLRLINKHVDISPGLILRIPPQRIVAVDPPEVTALRDQTPSDVNRGMVEAVPVDGSTPPKALLVRPGGAGGGTPASSGKTYVVKAGDTIWGIANQYKVSPDALLQVNGIRDARKMKVGAKLVIPVN